MSKHNKPSTSGEKSYKILKDERENEKIWKMERDCRLNNIPFRLNKTAVPLHVRRIEQRIDLTQFLKNVDCDESSSDEENIISMSSQDIENVSKDINNTADYYNLTSVSTERKWLVDIIKDTAQNTPEDVQYQHMLSLHSYKNKIREKSKKLSNYMYYGAGLLSAIDKYPEVEKIISATKKKSKEETIIPPKPPLYPPREIMGATTSNYLEMSLESEMESLSFEDHPTRLHFDFLMPSTSTSGLPPPVPPPPPKRKGRKFKDEESKRKWEDMMLVRRKKLFMNIVKKEIPKQQRSKMNKHKEMLIQCKKVAQQCSKFVRQKAVQSARIVKEQQWRMKRLSRENIAYWKRSRRFDREIKKRLEKEAEEQRKIDHELIEAKRQQRKLNFLITQTELYAHFMSRKLGQASPEEQLRILSQLDEEKNPRLIAIDDYDSNCMKEKAKKNAHDAFHSERSRTKHFDVEAKSSLIGEIEPTDGEHPQPNIFKGKLKGYQLRGMNWLANLYSQGISGILADEMGLGKTVQSIAFLCHIAEKYSVWGPFLIISPASTLHNWQQEIAKFVPSFKVVPYWGNPNERKILRQFWDQKGIYTINASFHIVVTSYQIVITDIKYFNRIKWQYMILDEAQAIKSSNSMRWKTLLGFSCRNRLLLSGTPIQNSMAELWALLHFIMPTLFDSHEEFNEWFSKDIESHAENKTGIDEKHLSRLHMILKPFMLRRIKKDVENELSDKIEVMMYCPQTTRQKLLYMALKQKIKIEDLIHYTVGGGGDAHSVDKNFTSNLMNLVMQFRKVCNHPELFERRDAKSPITSVNIIYNLPRLAYDVGVQAKEYYKINKLLLFSQQMICKAYQNGTSTLFNFCKAVDISYEELYQILQGNVLCRWKHYFDSEKKYHLQKYRRFWIDDVSMPNINITDGRSISSFDIDSSLIFQDLIFTRLNTARKIVYGHANHIFHYMFETLEHKNIRNKHANVEEDAIIDVVNEESPIDKCSIGKMALKNRTPYIREKQRTELPSFLTCVMPKIESKSIELYCSSRKAAWDLVKHTEDYSYDALNYFWSNSTGNRFKAKACDFIHPRDLDGLERIMPYNGWSHIVIPNKETLVTDSGKLSVLDSLLKRLKEEGHRVLIYSQMTKMIDLLEEYMWHRHYKHMRLDGSSKISERRDMVADFQARNDIFVFLLSTRAGGLGINLTAADTVIFYDSDWNPTVDQQAMDRAHRLGQTKQVTVYRLICKGTIEERILQRAREKSEIQKLVISGGNFKPDTLKPKEVVSLLLDEEELMQKVKYGAKNDPAKVAEENERKRKQIIMSCYKAVSASSDAKKMKIQDPATEDPWASVDSTPNSPRSANSDVGDDVSDLSTLDDTDGSLSSKYTVYNVYGSTVKHRSLGRGSSKRGRPRGSRRATSTNRNSSTSSATSAPPLYSTGSDISITEIPPTSASSSNGSILDVSFNSSPSGVRRGPGRPRLKLTGPLNAGSRGSYRPRKPARPLPVPLSSDGTSNNVTPASNSLSYASYIYEFQEYPD